MVEDNDGVAEVFAQALTAAGHDVDHSVTPEGARIRVVRDRYDVVLMDIALIGYDGAVLAVELRELGYRGPILMITGGMVGGDPTAVAVAGFTAELRKPVLPTELVAAVDTCLKQEEPS